MTETKTKLTGASVKDYLASKASEQQHADCLALMAMLKKITGKPPKMWGPTIVGYGMYRYTYESGHSGEAPLAGFSIRGRDLVLYMCCDTAPQQALLSKVGKHSMGKSCFYFRRLEDLDRATLEKLVALSVADVKRRYG